MVVALVPTLDSNPVDRAVVKAAVLSTLHVSGK